ncbi:MAG: hypothetical protein ABIP61_16350, partial [Burkholderiaceae bacterium]
DLRVVDLWKQGDWKTFCAMLPEYAKLCEGEGGMHDTAMLLGALGGARYDQGVEIITPYFPSSGTGQINAIFPVTQYAPQAAAAATSATASASASAATPAVAAAAAGV